MSWPPQVWPTGHAGFKLPDRISYVTAVCISLSLWGLILGLRMFSLSVLEFLLLSSAEWSYLITC